MNYGKSCKRILETAELNAWIEARDEADRKHEESGEQGVGKYTPKFCKSCKGKPRVHTIQGWCIRNNHTGDALNQAVETSSSGGAGTGSNLNSNSNSEAEQLLLLWWWCASQPASMHARLPPTQACNLAECNLAESCTL